MYIYIYREREREREKEKERFWLKGKSGAQVKLCASSRAIKAAGWYFPRPFFFVVRAAPTCRGIILTALIVVPDPINMSKIEEIVGGTVGKRSSKAGAKGR